MKPILSVACVLLGAVSARAQIQVELKLPRGQYIAHEPVVARLPITNLAGRDIDLRDGRAHRNNQLHVLHCASPRRWAYSHVGLNGELLVRSVFMESKIRPRLRHAMDGTVLVMGGTVEAPVTQSARGTVPRLSERSPQIPENE